MPPGVPPIRLPRRALWALLAIALLGGLPFLPARDALADGCADLLREAETLIGRGERAKDRGPLLQALKLLDRAEQACPYEPQAPFMAGLTCVLLGDKDAAAAAGRRLLGVLRQRSVEQNRPAAEADLEPRVLYLSALIRLYLQEDPVGAERQLTLVRQRAPAFMPEAVASALFSALLQVGSRQLRFGDFDAAERSMRKAEVLAGNNAGRRDAARRNLAQVFRADDRTMEAEKILAELAQAYPRDLVVHFGLASTYADQLKFPEAIRTWRVVLKLIDEKVEVDPRDLEQMQEARLRYGISVVLGNSEPEARREGLREVRAYADAHPDDARGWFQLGRLYLEEFEEYAPAAEHLEKALALDPWCERTLKLLVTVYTVHLPNPERAAKLANCLERNAGRRKAESELRKKARIDGTDGCF